MKDKQTIQNDFLRTDEWLRKEYSGIHTGRATPIVLDSVYVESYGAMQPIKNVASISIEDARTLRIAPWDKDLLKLIEKAIQASNIGLSVATDDTGLRVIFPMLTTENREKLVKVLKEKLEDARITVRKIRETVLDEIKNENLPEDDARRKKDELQKIVDETNQTLEATCNKKSEEILTQ